MSILCYNCGAISPKVERWKLVAEHKWSSTCKEVLNADNWKENETLDEAADRIGHNFFCPDCTAVNLSETFSRPIRLLQRRN